MQRPAHRVAIPPRPSDLLERDAADEVHAPDLRPLRHVDQRPPSGSPAPTDDQAPCPPGHRRANYPGAYFHPARGVSMFLAQTS
jgi:hypothetical protein